MPHAAALKVLIVGDQRSMRVLVRDGLQRFGFLHMEEADGEAGLQALRKNPAQLAISDCTMPKLDGMSLLRAVRLHPATARAA